MRLENEFENYENLYTNWGTYGDQLKLFPGNPEVDRVNEDIDNEHGY